LGGASGEIPLAKIAASLRLSEDEIDEIMRVESRLRIATIGSGDEINLTPMTFGWAGGRVYIFGRGQKIANLRRHSSATVLVDTGERWRDLRGIMMIGDARVLESAEDEAADDHLGSAQHNLGEKHGLTKDGVVAAYTPTASGRSRRWIVFTPTKVVSWNNEKLKQGRDT
jgi:nitroimidazol reductase NimA-like FMN-containing flavoprotein (pyridoxamine 5'-phosphate oxidase superfamily)